MAKVEVFDPAMCCSTGVCGVNVDQKLVQFAADLEWLKTKGVAVDRYNLAQQPDKFVQCGPVKNAMALAGEMCLPIILFEGKIVSRNEYPERLALAEMAGVA